MEKNKIMKLDSILSALDVAGIVWHQETNYL